MPTTRSIYLPESFLGKLAGVAPYVYDPAERSFSLQKGLTLAPAALLFYEVAVIGVEGSWWAPTAPQSLRPRSWPSPFLPLSNTGPGIWTRAFGEQVLRPQNFYWWIPAAVEKTLPLTPATNQGVLQGDFPLTGPKVA